MEEHARQVDEIIKPRIFPQCFFFAYYNEAPQCRGGSRIRGASELAEDEIMACVSLAHGQKLAEAELVESLRDDLPKFAVPRYVKVVAEFPKTETQRITKKELEKSGIVPGTYDAEKKIYIESARVPINR
jgi:hypothetical protein